ncbi:nucleoside deaminase [Companilactobacillus sp. DQM5]|uniref:nucleoside deaminase n=1 Tax=Companilactobacillus sp. DQM5 TaxID=3463359 RepID=UPI004059021F
MKTDEIFTENELELFMDLALQQAQLAKEIAEVPIGAIVVDNKTKKIIGKGFNKRETLQDSVWHAEIEAIQESCKKINIWRLENTTLFVTLEPCPMCAGAIINSRIPNVVYGAKDLKAGSVDTLNHLLTDARYNHQSDIVSGVKEDECATILKDFFQEIRKKNKS